MAKLYITRETDGTYRLRATRLAGKELAATKVARGVKRGDVGKTARSLMVDVGRQVITPGSA